MFSKNNKISIRQLEILLILNLFSNMSLMLPRVASELVGQDGWIIIIFGTFIAFIYVFIVTSLAKMFPNKTIVEYSELVLTKSISKVIGLLFAIKLMIMAAFEIRIFGELIKQTLLRETPIEIIMITMLVLVAYLTRKGYESRARMAELLIFFIIVPIIFIFLFAVPDAKLYNFAPAFVSKPSEILFGSYIVSFAYIGLELLLISTPFITKPHLITKSAIKSIIIVGILNVSICLLTLGTFGAQETSRQLWPVMAIMQVIEVPGAFVERQDAMMMSFWIMTVFLLINGYLFFTAVLTKNILKIKDQTFLILPLLPIIYLISLIPDNVVEVYNWIGFIIQYFGTLFLVPIPIIILIIAKLRKLGVNSE